MHPILESRLNSPSPCCGNCAFWTKEPACESWGKCGLSIQLVPDLGMCSGWDETRDGQIIKPGDE